MDFDLNLLFVVLMFASFLALLLTGYPVAWVLAGVLASAMYSDGSGFDFICMPGGGALHPPHEESTMAERLPYIKMRGNETFKTAVRSMEEVCNEVLASAGLTAADVDLLVPHQANIRIIQATAKKLGMGMDQVVVTVDRHGNTSAASIPLAFDVAVRDGRIERGHKVIVEGFGGGFAWGSALLVY